MGAFTPSFMLIPLIITTVTSKATDSNLCIFNQNRKLINCRGEHLYFIPYDYFYKKKFETLDLGMNDIASVNGNMFLNMAYKQEIKKIFLDNNQMTELPYNLFSNLPNIEILDLSSNRLKNIGLQFCNTTSLIEVILSDNPIENISNDSFNCLPNLMSLQFENCNMTELPIDMFKGSNLKYLELTGNSIKNIDKVYFPKDLKILQQAVPVTTVDYPSTTKDDDPEMKQTTAFHQNLILSIYVVSFVFLISLFGMVIYLLHTYNRNIGVSIHVDG